MCILPNFLIVSNFCEVYIQNNEALESHFSRKAEAARDIYTSGQKKKKKPWKISL